MDEPPAVAFSLQNLSLRTSSSLRNIDENAPEMKTTNLLIYCLGKIGESNTNIIE